MESAILRRRLRRTKPDGDDSLGSTDEDDWVRGIRRYRAVPRFLSRSIGFTPSRTVSIAPSYIPIVDKPDLPELPAKAALKPGRFAFRRPGWEFIDDYQHWEAVVMSLESEKLLERLQWPALILRTEEQHWKMLTDQVKEGEDNQTKLEKSLIEINDTIKKLDKQKKDYHDQEQQLYQQFSEVQHGDRLREELADKEAEIFSLELKQEYQKDAEKRRAELRNLGAEVERLKQQIKEAKLQQQVAELKKQTQAQKKPPKTEERTTEDQESNVVVESEELRQYAKPAGGEAVESNDLEASREKQASRRHSPIQKSREDVTEEPGKNTLDENGLNYQKERDDGEGREIEAQDGTEMENEQRGERSGSYEGEGTKVSSNSVAKSDSLPDDAQISKQEEELKRLTENYESKRREFTKEEEEKGQAMRDKVISYRQTNYDKGRRRTGRLLRELRQKELQKEETQAQIEQMREKLMTTQGESKEGEIRITRLKEVQSRVTKRVDDLRKQLDSLLPEDKVDPLKEQELDKELNKVLAQELEQARKKVREEGKRQNLDEKKLASDKELNDMLTIHSSVQTELPEGLSIYRPIKGNEIRLLVVFPAPNQYYPVICALNQVQLTSEEDPKYAALSYWWGPEDEKTIYVLPDNYSNYQHRQYHVTGKDLVHSAIPTKVRTNLFCALHRLRRRDRPVMLWVDRLCINQDDVKEKAQQLDTMMVHIYQRAENVCIWLGERDTKGNSDMAMGFIPKIVDMATLDSCVDDKERAAEWAALAELMRDPWFSRRWVVQEIVLAKNATLHCGEKMVQWEDFVDAIFLLVINEERVRSLFDLAKWRYGPDTLGEIQSSSANVLLQNTNHLFIRNEDGGLRSPSKSLEYLVTSLTTFNASNPRDIIYSLVQIAKDTSTSSFGAEGRGKTKIAIRQTANLKIAYDKDVASVYRDFTQFCIESSKSLDIICRHWAVKDTDLPSWIPLLEDSEFGKPGEEFRGRKNGESLVGRAGRARYRASEDENAVTEFLSESILSTRGFRLGLANSVSPVNQAGLILRESLGLLGWKGIESRDNLPGRNIEGQVPDQVWRTLIADRDSDGQVSPTWYQRVCLRCLEMADTLNNGDLNIGQLLPQASEMLRIYLTRVRSITWNRRFFQASTKKEQTQEEKATTAATDDEYETPKEDERKLAVGLCPKDTREGDLVCILFGCSVPVILRRTNDSYTLIGECYVHGKMDGEAITDLENGKTFSGREEFPLK